MKFKQGENKFRALSSPIVGMLGWTNESKPVRIKTGEEFTVQLKDKAKHFWSLVVWNYSTSAIEVLEITQKGIQEAIGTYAKDEEWGNPKGYDLKVIRSGEGMETSYQVSTSPHKDVAQEVIDAYDSTPVNLYALYDGGDPFETK